MFDRMKLFITNTVIYLVYLLGYVFFYFLFNFKQLKIKKCLI